MNAFEERLKTLYDSLDCEISYIAFRADVNEYLRESNELLNGAVTTRFIWATNEFEEWSRDMDMEDLIRIVIEYFKSTIYALPLPEKVQKTLVKAKIKYIDDLKELITNPANLSKATGLGLDIIEQIVFALAK